MQLGYQLASEEHGPNVQTVEQRVALGPDPADHLAAIRRYALAGFDHVHVHQIGPDQQGFFRFYEREVLPHLGSVGAGVGS
jgi:hypothetical protein